MTIDETQRWLKDGITAAKAGNPAEARELLLRVVNVDENNLQAWLWLSSVVPTLEDREVCLENVLALDPVNEAAQRGLARVRADMQAMPAIEPDSVLPHLEAEPKPETKVAFDFSDAELDDPLLCVYCAQRTTEDDTRCPRCKRTLYHRFYERDQPRWIWVAWTVSIAEAIFMVGVLLVLMTILSGALSVAQANGQGVDVVQVLSLYAGQKTGWPSQTQAAVLSVLPREHFYLRLGFVIFNLIVACGLLTRKRIFHVLYVVTLVLAALLLYFNTTINRGFVSGGAAVTPLEGILQTTLNEALGMLIMISGGIFGLLLLLKIVLAFAMNDDFETRTERLWCVIDRTVRDSNGAFIRAKTYMQREMWTLAALYLQRAVSMQPSIVDYYLALAESYAHLERYPQSLALLDDAGQLQPDSPIIPNLRSVIAEMQQRAQSAGGI